MKNKELKICVNLCKSVAKKVGIFFVIVAMSTMAFADVVTMKSGDKLTGKVTGGDLATLKFTSDAAGDITLKCADIATVTSGTLIPVELKDGTIVTAMVSVVEGQMELTDVQTKTVIDSKNVEEVNPTPSRWVYSVVGSYVANRGNTHNDTYSLTAAATFRNRVHRIFFGAGYAYARQKDVDTGEVTESVDNWHVQGQYDYFVIKALYAYVNAKHEADNIAGLKGRETVGTGLGYQWIDRPDFGFKTEGGITYFHEKYDDGEGGYASRDVVSLRLAYGLTKNIGSSVQLFHNVEYLPDVTAWNVYLMNVDAGGRVRLTTHILFEAKAEWRYNSRPLVDNVERLDSRYTLGLGYTF